MGSHEEAPPLKDLYMYNTLAQSSPAKRRCSQIDQYENMPSSKRAAIERQEYTLAQPSTKRRCSQIDQYESMPSAKRAAIERQGYNHFERETARNPLQPAPVHPSEYHQQGHNLEPYNSHSGPFANSQSLEEGNAFNNAIINNNPFSFPQHSSPEDLRASLRAIETATSAGNPFYEIVIRQDTAPSNVVMPPWHCGHGAWHCREGARGWRFKSLRCLLHTAEREMPSLSSPVVMGMSDSHGIPGGCGHHIATREAYSIYDAFEKRLMEDSNANEIIAGICYNRMTPLELVRRFGVFHMFQPYIQVATWAEFEDLFSHELLNRMVNELVDEIP